MSSTTSSRKERQSHRQHHFFTLPPEIRQRVLRYVLPTQVVPLHCYRLYKHLICIHCHMPRDRKYTIFDSFSLLLTSHKMLDDCRHLMLPALIGRVEVPVMSLEDTPDHQGKCYHKRRHLKQLDSQLRVSVVSCLRRLIINLENAPVLLAPLLELEQIRLGPQGCTWGGPDEDRSEEVAALRNRRLTVIMPQLESINILATMNFFSMWVLPEEAGPFRYYHAFASGIDSI